MYALDNVDNSRRLFMALVPFRIFNTNNLWINMKAIERVVEECTLHMEVIINPKVRYIIGGIEASRIEIGLD